MSWNVLMRGAAPVYGSAPAWFTAMNDKTWSSSVVSNTLDAVKPSGASNQNNICDAWTGGCVVGTEFMLGANGGHTDYGGNEVYACDFSLSAPAWARLTNPSSETGGSDAEGSTMALGDGKPRARHGYNRCVGANGRLWYAGVDGVSVSGSFSKACYSFRRSDTTWLYHGNPAIGGTGSGGWESGPSAYDPVTDRVYSFAGYATGNGGYSVLASSTGTSDIVEYDTPLFGNPFHYAWAVIANGCFIVVSPHDACVYAIALSSLTAGSTTGFTTRTPTGSPDAYVEGAGGHYHAASGAILCWHRSFGTSLRKLTIPANPLTGSYVWSSVAVDASNSVNPASGSVGASYQGNFSKFNLIQDMGNGQSACVLVESTTGLTYVYKLPAAGV